MGSDNPLTFIRQSFRDFRHTGALAPSSAFLARGMAGVLPRPLPDDFRVLEVGPGTGSITRAIAKRMNGAGQLDLWEISPEFCAVLRKLAADDAQFCKMNGRLHVHEGDVRTLQAQAQYDAIISGLPFNCFSADEVAGFLEHFKALLRPGGTLTWFEYVAIRRLQAPFVGAARRKQLNGIRDVTHNFARAHQFRQELIPINLPPARVRHLKFG